MKALAYLAGLVALMVGTAMAQDTIKVVPPRALVYGSTQVNAVGDPCSGCSSFIFMVNDGEDAGCTKGCAACGDSSGAGMPTWGVSEPYINLWVTDKPAAYKTSLGEMFFQMRYNQRDMRPTNFLGASFINGGLRCYPTTGWNHNWYSYIKVDGDYVYVPNQGYKLRFDQWRAVVYAPGGGESYYSYDKTFHADDKTQLLPQDAANKDVAAGYNSTQLYLIPGFRLVQQDGSQDIYGTLLNGEYNLSPLDPYPTAQYALRTKHLDPYGNVTSFYYTNWASLPQMQYVLRHVVDPDGKTNTLTYDSNCKLTRVDMPYGRHVDITNNAQGQVQTITDTIGMQSSFLYDPMTGFMTNMTTPYGVTRFEHTDLGDLQNGKFVGNAGGSNRVSRACLVTLPTGGKELYAYRFDSSQVGVAKDYSSQAPTGTPLNTFDVGGDAQPQSPAWWRNTYHWSARQHDQISTTNIPSMTASDYKLGARSHWLVRAGTTNYLSSTISVAQDPSPDGTLAGQLVWFDYPGRTSSTLWSEGDATQPLAVAAQKLPDGTTQYQWAFYDDQVYPNMFGLPNLNVSTYSKADGTIGTRTNTFIYTNVIWMLRYRDTYSTYGSIYPPTWDIYWTNSMLIAVKGPRGETTFISGLTNQTVTDILFGAGFLRGTNTYTVPVLLRGVYTDASNNVTIATFNNRHQLTGFQTPAGLHHTNYYGTSGFLSRSIDLETTRTNGFGFVNGMLTTRTNELGLVTSYAWDELLRLTQVAFPDGTTLSNVYDRLDLAAQKDRMGHWNYASYNSLRQLETLTDPLGNQTTLAYCSCGALDSISDPQSSGNNTGTTAFVRDNIGRLLDVLSHEVQGGSPVSIASHITRDILGRPVTITDVAGVTVTNTYNHQGLVTKVTGPNGTLMETRYDIHDRPEYLINADGMAVTNTYDLLGRVLTRSSAAGVLRYLYSGALQTAEVDPLGCTNWFAYDAAGRLTWLTNAIGDKHSFGYDAANHLKFFTDGKNQKTGWAYNTYGQNIAETNAANVVVRTNGYNADGQLVKLWTRAKGLTSFYPDANGNITNVTYPSSGTVSVSYNALNQPVDMIDALGTTTFGYAKSGAFRCAFASEATPWSRTVSAQYVNRRLTGLSVSGGSWSQSFGYDNQGRLQSITTPAGSFSFGYNGPGRELLTLSAPAGTSTQDFDGVGNLETTTLRDQVNNILDSAAYGYDAAGQRTNYFRTDGSQVKFTYDKIGQLTKALGYESTGTARLNEVFGYGYDAIGNLISRTNGALVQTFNVNSLNYLTNITRNALLTAAGSLSGPANSMTVNGQSAAIYKDNTFATTAGVSLNNGGNTFTYSATDKLNQPATTVINRNLPLSVTNTYDDNGNLLYDGARNFVFDDANRMTQVYVTNTWNCVYTYDGFSRRRIRRAYNWQSNAWNLTNETHYLWAGGSVIQELNAINMPVVSYTRGLGLLARTDANGSLFYHQDGNDNVTALVDGQGTLKARYTYDPYGNLIAKSGPMADANLYRHASQEVHPNSGLYAYTYRFYDPNLQRWLNRDPIGFLGGRNQFTFVGNNPINRFDPYGLAWYNPVDWYNGIVNAISDPIARLWTGGIDAQGNAAITAMLSAHDYNGMQDYQMQHPGYGGDITAGNTDANAAIANMASGSANLYVTAATMVTPTATGARCISILAKNGTKITGFTGHGIERAVGGAVGRAGVKPQAILDALQNPLKITSGVDQLGRPFQIFVGQDARVVVNPQTGNVVSVNPLSGAGAH